MLKITKKIHFENHLENEHFYQIAHIIFFTKILRTLNPIIIAYIGYFKLGASLVSVNNLERTADLVL